jgi:hypothetical protein
MIIAILSSNRNERPWGRKDVLEIELLHQCGDREMLMVVFTRRMSERRNLIQWYTLGWKERCTVCWTCDCLSVLHDKVSRQVCQEVDCSHKPHVILTDILTSNYVSNDVGLVMFVFAVPRPLASPHTFRDQYRSLQSESLAPFSTPDFFVIGNSQNYTDLNRFRSQDLPRRSFRDSK